MYMPVHLHIRTSYSLLDSTIRIPSLIRKAKEEGYTSLVLADHNVLFAVPSFLKACSQAGIKGIIGLEADCQYHDQKLPFLLIARNRKGYQALLHLSSIICMNDSFCSVEDLIQAKKDCFLICYGEGGYVDGELLADDRQGLQKKLQEMKEELGEFDMAESFQESASWREKNAVLKQICTSLHISCVAVNKIYYLEEKDSFTYKALRAIALNTYLEDPSLIELKGRYFLSVRQMKQLYGKEELQRTEQIAEECVTDYDSIKTSLPDYPLKKGVDAREYLQQLCIVGLKKRLQDKVSDVYISRLKKELQVILDMHFEEYFLIVFDYIRYAKKHGILVGPGRGSAAGSLVAYSLGITEVDPIRYNLLFERFLTKDRVTLPDIDTDFPDTQRQEVIDYVVQEYGKEHVANIITFSTLSARAVLRDVARILRMPEKALSLLLKQLPNGKFSLRDYAQHSVSFQRFVKSEPQFLKAVHLAMTLEGLPRNMSQHAAGIVLSKKPLEQVVPLIRLKEDIPTVQYEAGYLEERGLIKMDFLSLRNLSVIDSIVKEIRKQDVSFVLPLHSFEDRAVYEAFSSGDTNGVFQFESEEMKRLLRKLKPRCFEDIVAANALNRPGAYASMDTFIANRSHPSSVSYLTEDLKPYLKETYGVLLYQEQIMQIAQHLAGFSPGYADTLRKAISKKNADQMQKMQKDFLSGCRRNGYAEEVVSALWAMIEKFGSYGFNKSHSVAYSILSYQMGYLKVKYPLYFYCALMNSVLGDTNKLTMYIDECKRKDIPIAPLSVQESREVCFIKENALVLPLSIIKGTGSALALSLVEERNRKGPFEDYFDFVARMLLHRLSVSSLQAYIDAGALDCFRETRETLRNAVTTAMNYGEIIQIRKGEEITIDTDLVSKPALQKFKESPSEKMRREKEALGFCLNNEDFIEAGKRWNIQDPPLAAIKQQYGKEVQSFARIVSIYEKTSKSNHVYCRLALTDGLTDCFVNLWPSEYARVKGRLQEGMFIRFHGKMDEKGYIQVDRVQIFQQEE